MLSSSPPRHSEILAVFLRQISRSSSRNHQKTASAHFLAPYCFRGARLRSPSLSYPSIRRLALSSMAKLDEPIVHHTDRETRVLSVRNTKAYIAQQQDIVSDTDLDVLWKNLNDTHRDEAQHLKQAALALLHSNIPVAFPTETVYGLGADATRGDAVRGIYAAKQRPADNPLIVHVCSREGLLRLLRSSSETRGSDSDEKPQIPPIYEPLIARFWPGPLTIILPTPTPSSLAKEVTSHLHTFGARMPSSVLARLLIHVTGKPLAAPSANASTKPSPTTAEHVLTDMRGRIDFILDGGSCGVGVESTVVDGLSSPPAILRPGGVGIEEIRKIEGWEDVRIAYKDRAQAGVKADDAAPRAPGMKYRHYSPKAKVTLFECGDDGSAADFHDVKARVLEDGFASVGLVRTRSWPCALEIPVVGDKKDVSEQQSAPSSQGETDAIKVTQFPAAPSPNNSNSSSKKMTIHEVALGPSTDSVARGLFSALRALDECDVSVVYVEGIPDTDGDLAGAVMNRLRKAAEEDVRKH